METGFLGSSYLSQLVAAFLGTGQHFRKHNFSQILI